MHTQWTHPYSPLKKLELGTTCLGDHRPSWDHGGGRGCVEGSPTYLAWVPTTWAMKSEHKVLIEGAPILLESRGQMSRGMGVGHGGGVSRASWEPQAGGHEHPLWQERSHQGTSVLLGPAL